MRDTQREGGRDTGRGRSRLPAGRWMQDSISGPQGSCPGPKAGAKPLSHPGVLTVRISVMSPDHFAWVEVLGPPLVDLGKITVSALPFSLSKK